MCVYTREYRYLVCMYSTSSIESNDHGYMYRMVWVLTKFILTLLRQSVHNLGAESGVSGRTRLLPGTLAHALEVVHNAWPPGHETSHNG
jgi:hypothetical protein